MTQEPKIFPYIARLLQGAEVVWKPLGEVAEIKRGQRVTKQELSNDKQYPVYSGGVKPMGYYDAYNQEANTITIVKYGTAGYVNFITERFWANDVCYCIKPHTILENKYLLYVLKNMQVYINSLATDAIPAHLPAPSLSSIPIPLPPLSVQQEIVRILDKFTELEAELEAELDCRKRQYDYYRNHLLSYEENEVEWKALGEVVKTTKNIKWQNNENTYDYIDLTSVCRETGNVLETLKIKADNAPSRAQKMVQLDDVIFATTRPSQMRIALIPKKFDGQIASTGYCILRADKVNVLPKWIFFTLSTTEFKKFVAENQSGTAYPAISDSKLKEFKIPLPPLSEQQRIVGILDKFDTLVHSISEGLPREIELRKKQYEYYREQLLSFPEYKVTA